MNVPSKQEEVKARIAMLEEQTQAMKANLRIRINETYNALSPANLVKSAISGITSDTKLRNSLLNRALSLGLDYIGSRLFWSPAGGIGKKAVGAAIQLGNNKDLVNRIAVLKKFLANLFTKDKK